MATKKENRDTVIELIDELGLKLDVPEVDDLKASEWAAMVSDLKAKKRDNDNVTLIDDATEADSDQENDEPEAAPVADGSVYYVKAGCSITSRKGVIATEKGKSLNECTQVNPDWLVGGIDTLEKLVNSGHVGKK